MYIVCMHECMHARMHACMHAHMHVCMHVCSLFACMYIVCMHACMYVCMHAYNEHNSRQSTEKKTNDIKCDFIKITAQLCNYTD